MKVDAFHVTKALVSIERHSAKLHQAAARAISKGEHQAADALDAEANGVDWAARQLRLAVMKRPIINKVPHANPAAPSAQ